MWVSYDHESLYDKVDSVTSNTSTPTNKGDMLDINKRSISDSSDKNEYGEYTYDKINAKKVGIILAAGKNSRGYPASYYLPKALFPIGDRPAIFFSIAQLITCGIKYICIVTNDSNDTAIRKIAEYYTKGEVKIFTTKQKEFNGPIDGIKLGIDCLIYRGIDISNETNIYIYFADNIFFLAMESIKSYIEGLKHYDENKDNNQDPDIALITYPTKHPEKFGIAIKDEEGKYKILEKPKNLYGIQEAVVGFYMYSNKNNNFIRLLNNFYDRTSITGIKYSITDFNNEFMQIPNIEVSCDSLDSGYPNAKDIDIWYDIGSADEYMRCCAAYKTLIEHGIGLHRLGVPEVAGAVYTYYNIKRDFIDHILDPDYSRTKYIQFIIDENDRLDKVFNRSEENSNK